MLPSTNADGEILAIVVMFSQLEIKRLKGFELDKDDDASILCCN